MSAAQVLTNGQRIFTVGGVFPQPKVVLRGERLLAYFVVVPTHGRPALADSAGHLVGALRDLAQSFCGESVQVLAVDMRERQLWHASTGEPVSSALLQTRRLQVLMNAGFLLADPPPITQLVERAERDRGAWCALRSTRDAYACAFTPRIWGGYRLWPALGLLTAGVGADVDDDWARIARTDLLAPLASSSESSPAMAGIQDARSRRAFDSPRFLNTAFGEMMSCPQDLGAVAGRPERLADALLVQRDISRVPWVFNSLLNDIEYRLGRVDPESCPPEVHLSITGLCNIECRFCAYEHGLAKTGFVDVSMVERLDMLRYVQTFRLHSGLGEPTTNRHLATIIKHVASRFPHVGMNFFTNAVSLDRPGLIEALVGNTRWINASLNAATRASFFEVCKADLFDRVCRNLRTLHQAKRVARSLLPLVFGSTVLTRATLADLPRMPALCRDLGVDRLSAFPYSSLGYHGRDKFGPDMTLEACRDEYDQVYEETVREAEAHQVSIEIPLPGAQKRVAFGVEARPLHDFARIESNEWALGRFVGHLYWQVPHGKYCHFLWRSAGIGSTNRAGHTAAETHYLYPCIGPLSGVDLSRRTGFRFPDAHGFRDLWHNPVFTLLRRAQRDPGVSTVCDMCRSADTRDPKHFPRLEQAVARFAQEHCQAAP